MGVTQAARELIEELKRQHGPILFHQSGGCCDDSAPMVFRVGDFKLGGVDLMVGEIAGCGYFMDRAHYARLAHTRWVVDAVPGRGAGFSLESSSGRHFVIRSELCTPES